MLKITCNFKREITSNYLEFDYTTILKFFNCNICQYIDIKITDYSNHPFNQLEERLIIYYNNRTLDPTIPKHKAEYDKLIDQNLLNFQYMTIVEDNQKINSLFSDSCKELIDNGSFINHNAYPIYDGFVNKSNYEIWGRPFYINFIEPPVINPGTLTKNENGYFIDDSFLQYILGETPLSCLNSNSNENLTYEGYISSIKSKIKRTIEKFNLKMKICNINGLKAGMVESSTDQKADIYKRCADLGGKIATLEEGIKENCEKKHHKDFIIYGNEAYNLSCNNYEEILKDLGLSENDLNQRTDL